MSFTKTGVRNTHPSAMPMQRNNFLAAIVGAELWFGFAAPSHATDPEGPEPALCIISLAEGIALNKEAWARLNQKVDLTSIRIGSSSLIVDLIRSAMEIAPIPLTVGDSFSALEELNLPFNEYIKGQISCLIVRSKLEALLESPSTFAASPEQWQTLLARIDAIFDDFAFKPLPARPYGTVGAVTKEENRRTMVEQFAGESARGTALLVKQVRVLLFSVQHDKRYTDKIDSFAHWSETSKRILNSDRAAKDSKALQYRLDLELDKRLRAQPTTRPDR